MGERKHTPGPWYATTRQGSWDWVVAQSESIEVCQMFHDGTPENETGEANARLVASAPDLLEALELLCDEISMSMPDEPQEFNARNIWRAFAQANSAIARAQGKG